MRLTLKEVLVVLFAVAAAAAAFIGPKWQAKAALKGQAAAEPFRLAGNFYYVGASDISAFLLTGPEGHILLGAGYATTVPLIMGSIAKLGVDIRDVKVLLASEGDPWNAGGLKVLQEASGAAVWASEPSAGMIAAGGARDDLALPLDIAMRIGFLRYDPPRVDRRFRDGETIQVGPTAVTAHLTAGGSRGCTSWTFQVRDGDRVLNAVIACPLAVVLGMRYPEQRDDIERSLRVLRSLPVDIWATSHARAWGRYRKYVASQSASNAADAFIDPEGYRDFVNAAEDEFRRGVTH